MQPSAPTGRVRSTVSDVSAMIMIIPYLPIIAAASCRSPFLFLPLLLYMFRSTTRASRIIVRTTQCKCNGNLRKTSIHLRQQWQSNNPSATQERSLQNSFRSSGDHCKYKGKEEVERREYGKNLAHRTVTFKPLTPMNKHVPLQRHLIIHWICKNYKCFTLSDQDDVDYY